MQLWASSYLPDRDDGNSVRRRRIQQFIIMTFDTGELRYLAISRIGVYSFHVLAKLNRGLVATAVYRFKFNTIRKSLP